MNSRVFSSSILLIAILVLPTQGQKTDFFWSFYDLNQGAENGPASKVFQVGDEASIFLYYSTFGPNNSDLELGAIMDVWTSRTGAIKFTNAETLNYDILFSQYACGRWGFNFGICIFGLFGAWEFGTVEDDLVNEWGAFAVDSPGIRQGFFFDTGYDENANAFLFGRIDFEVLTDTRGSIELHIAPGNGMVINEWSCLPQIMELEYGSATIEIEGSYLLGDVNLDDEISLLDIAPFVELLQSNQFLLEADTNFDGQVNVEDIDGFVDLIVGFPGPDNPPLGEPQDNLLGDVNCDGFVNMIDGPCLVELIEFDLKPCNFFTADINQDEAINYFDIRVMAETIVENIE